MDSYCLWPQAGAWNPWAAGGTPLARSRRWRWERKRWRERSRTARLEWGGGGNGKEKERGKGRWKRRWEKRRKLLEEGRETWLGDERSLLFLQLAAAVKCSVSSPGSSASTGQGVHSFLTLHPGLLDTSYSSFPSPSQVPEFEQSSHPVASALLTQQIPCHLRQSVLLTFNICCLCYTQRSQERLPLSMGTLFSQWTLQKDAR